LPSSADREKRDDGSTFAKKIAATSGNGKFPRRRRV
jgi:hypothetical protein